MDILNVQQLMAKK